MDADDQSNWKKEFRIQSTVDLDFVIGQQLGYPIGMLSGSPAEFRRRVLAAKLSYELRLKSIDYTLKHYVDPEVYEVEDITLGDTISNYLRDALSALGNELGKLHTQGEVTFGVFGAEITLFRVPHALDTARMLSNRGLLLEVLPLLRTCLEMIAWAHTAFYLTEEEAVVELKAQNCISSLKETYKSVGRLYGFLSRFTHWGHAIHREFLGVEEEKVSVLQASVRYRMMSLALCLVLLDVIVEVSRKLYQQKSDSLVLGVLEAKCSDPARKLYQLLSKAADVSGLKEMREIHSLLQ